MFTAAAIPALMVPFLQTKDPSAECPTVGDVEVGHDLLEIVNDFVNLGFFVTGVITNLG